MPANTNLLTNQTDCNEALTSLQSELAIYQHRDGNIDFADNQTAPPAAPPAAPAAWPKPPTT